MNTIQIIKQYFDGINYNIESVKNDDYGGTVSIRIDELFNEQNNYARFLIYQDGKDFYIRTYFFDAASLFNDNIKCGMIFGDTIKIGFDDIKDINLFELLREKAILLTEKINDFYENRKDRFSIINNKLDTILTFIVRIENTVLNMREELKETKDKIE